MKKISDSSSWTRCKNWNRPDRLRRIVPKWSDVVSQWLRLMQLEGPRLSVTFLGKLKID